MAGLGEALGSGFKRGVSAGIKEGAKERQATALAKARAFKDNMKRVADVASIWQFKDGEVSDLDDPKVKQRIVNELTLQFSDLSEGGKVSPRAKAIINVLAGKEITEAKSLTSSMLKSAGQGGFNMLTFVNVANSGKPGAIKAYLDQTLGAGKRAAETGKLKAEEENLRAKTKNLTMLQDIMKKRQTRKAQEQTQPGVSPTDPDLELAGDLALLNPQASRALRGTVAEKRLQPAGVVKTAQAKARGDNTSEVPKADLVFLGLDPSKPETPASLAARNIRIPSPKQKARLLTVEAATKKSFSAVRGIIRKVENRPELLSIPGFIARSYANLTSIVEGTIRLVGGEFIEPGEGRSFLNSLPVLGNLGRTAEESANVKSQIIDLTFKAGSLINATGAKRFTNQDFGNIATQLAAGTADPAIMVGVLRTFVLINNNAFNSEFETFTGTRKFVGLPRNDAGVPQPFSTLTNKEFSGVIKELLTERQLDLYEASVRRRLRKIQ